MITHVGLFEGYGGTSMAAARVLGPLNSLWVSDIKPASITLLRHRQPDVPNLGNLTALFPYDRERPTELGLDPHWQPCAPVIETFVRPDVLTASWPCQPHSSAGKRLGEVDPRALWPNVARAIATLRPRIFLGENVARITSNSELRRVVRSLADLGYVGAWRVLRASDIYAPHRRERCFVVAVDAAAHPVRDGWHEGRPEHDDVERLTQAAQPGTASDLTLLPTPCKRDGKGPGLRNGERPDGYARSLAQLDLPGAIQLLPTPTQSMTTGAGTSGRDGGLNLQTAITLLPTPSAQSYGTNQGGAAGRTGPVRESLDTMARHDRLVDGWGQYAEAIARWGCAFDREAPAPTQLGTKGQPQLSPAFVEWMMGLPQGHVTDVPGLTRNQQLSLLGDGVVPQQGAAAFSFLLDQLAQRLAVAA